MEAESLRLLGVEPGATAKEIRAAFRRQAMIHHPDRNPGNSEAEERFKEILRAYQIALRTAKRPQPEPEAPVRQTANAATPESDIVYRSRRSGGSQALNRFMLFLLFTLGPLVFLLAFIWMNTPTDWLPNCCPEIEIKEEASPFDPLPKREPVPIEELELEDPPSPLD